MNHISVGLQIATCTIIGIATVAISSLHRAFADELDTLLAPVTDTKSLVDKEATTSWNAVVEAFRKNDMQKAAQLGQVFLAGDFKASPYQVLGVKVMMKLAGDEGSTATSNVASKEELGGVMTERAQITARYNQLRETIRIANAKIDKLTNFRRTAVQAGTAAYNECVRNGQTIEQANAELETLNPAIEKNRQEATQSKSKIGLEIKSDTLRLLDMLVEANELEAAFAIANVYIRKIGDDLEIAKRQQDVIRLQEVHLKADKIVEAIHNQQKPLLVQKLFWTAKDAGQKALSRVEQQASDKDLIRMVKQSLASDQLGIDSTISKAKMEAAAITKLSSIDSRKAAGALQSFKDSYPDYPELQVVSLGIAGDRSGEVKIKLGPLIEEIGSLAEADPEKALQMIQSLDGQDVDPLERTALEARISNVKAKVVSRTLLEAQSKISEAKSNMGGQVLELTANSKQSSKTGIFSSDEATAAQTLRARIDHSADLPKVRASLANVVTTLNLVGKQKLTDQQLIQLSALKNEARILQLAVN